VNEEDVHGDMTTALKRRSPNDQPTKEVIWLQNAISPFLFPPGLNDAGWDAFSIGDHNILTVVGKKIRLMS
jgi:hypothetical protein